VRPNNRALSKILFVPLSCAQGDDVVSHAPVERKD
jgi:hypothetical protein